MFARAGLTNYSGRGLVMEIRPGERQVVVAHDAIPEFMDAMTMPFNVKEATLLTNLTVGAKIRFLLHVTETESWIDDIEVLAQPSPATQTPPAPPGGRFVPGLSGNAADLKAGSALLRDYHFTNELGQPIRLAAFRGQALALTFIFTRCPVPEFCPRLSRNFQAVQARLQAMENAPTNWHLISVTFDPERDTPAVLKAYGAAYQSDPAHWSFLTGSKDKIAELARFCGVEYHPENGLFNHNFRTLIVNTSNQLQMVFPTSGDLSESIVQELLKATGTTNRINKLTAGQGNPDQP